MSDGTRQRMNLPAEVGPGVGQGVGLMNQSMSCGQVVQQFREEFLEARERLIALLDEG